MRRTTWRYGALALLGGILLLAGCGAQATSARQGVSRPQTTGLQPDRVRIVRTASDWQTNSGTTPAPAAVDMTSTDAARVVQFYDHTISLSTYTIAPDAQFSCPIAYGIVKTTITFSYETTAILQVQIVSEGCVFVSVVGGPKNTYLQTDDTFNQELNSLIAKPA